MMGQLGFMYLPTPSTTDEMSELIGFKALLVYLMLKSVFLPAVIWFQITVVYTPPCGLSTWVKNCQLPPYLVADKHIYEYIPKKFFQ